MKLSDGVEISDLNKIFNCNYCEKKRQTKSAKQKLEARKLNSVSMI